MHQYIKESHGELQQYNSIKHFTERAVNNNAEEIYKLVRGADDVRRFLEEFSAVEGIEIPIPEADAPTQINDEQVERMTRIGLDPESLERISDIQDSTAMTRSEVIRICVIWELAEVCKHDGVLESPHDRRIRSTQSAIQRNFEYLFRTAKTSLEYEIVEQTESTRQSLLMNQRTTQDLRDHYENYFKHSPGYQRLVDEYDAGAIFEQFEELIDTAL